MRGDERVIERARAEMFDGYELVVCPTSAGERRGYAETVKSTEKQDGNLHHGVHSVGLGLARL